MDFLEERVRKATATGRVTVSVPYARMTRDGSRGWKMVHGEATGIHGGTGNLITREGGGPSRQETYATRGFFRPPSAGHAAEMKRLLDTRDKADAAYTALVEAYAFPAGSLASQVKAEVDRVREGKEGTG
jgi:hypothetical protein